MAVPRDNGMLRDRTYAYWGMIQMVLKQALSWIGSTGCERDGTHSVRRA